MIVLRAQCGLGWISQSEVEPMDGYSDCDERLQGWIYKTSSDSDVECDIEITLPYSQPPY